MSDTSTRTAELLEHVSEAAEQASEWLAQRDEWIVAAVRAGAGQREVARAAGLSHPGVAKIVARTTVDA